MYVPAAVTQQSKIESAIDELERALAPNVVRIRYEIAKDWSDQWAIFFRIVLSDDAAKFRIRDLRRQVVEGLARSLDFTAMGVLAYHNFRSASEQAALQEPAWA
ncbi:MAG: hypothetical protein U0Q16_29360 [Bryobacteraceae bacterium]